MAEYESDDQIEAICDRFEAAWRGGNEPKIEDFVTDDETRQQTALLVALLVQDIQYRRKQGASPGFDEYSFRFPNHSDAIRFAFAQVGDNEQRPQRRENEQVGDREVLYGILAMHVSANRSDDQSVSATIDLGESSSKGTRFRKLRPHAKGGLGEVFVAQDVELNREVALKQIQERFADNAECRVRFQLEAEVTGSLEHPGIVPVYGLGQYDNGRPFYAMRMVRGDSLKEAIEEFHRANQPSYDSIAFRKLLARFIDICDAIHYAHSRGVLHRDLKPGNIMLGKFGETLVVDWGLTKVAGRKSDVLKSDEGTLQPSSGSSASPTMGAHGSYGYMSPEQAAGQIDEIGTATDVFSLGATLYSLLTGRAPFQGKNRDEILDNTKQYRFARPRELSRNIPAALEAICLKAMAFSAGERYESPESLRRDIEAWLADEQVSAKADSLISRSARWARRHRSAVLAAGMALLLITAASVLATVLIRRSEQDAIRAQQAAVKSERDAIHAQKEAEAARDMNRSLVLIDKSKSIHQRKPNLSLLLAIEAVEFLQRSDVPILVQAKSNLWDAMSHVAGTPISHHQGTPKKVRFSPDSKWLAVASDDGIVRLWHPTDDPLAEPRIILKHDSSVTSLSFRKDGRYLVTGTERRMIRVWDLTEPEQPVHEFGIDPVPLTQNIPKPPDPDDEFGNLLYGIGDDLRVAEFVEISPTGEWLAAGISDGSRKGEIRLWNLHSPKAEPYSLQASESDRDSYPVDLRISDDERWVITFDSEQGVYLWDLAANDPTETPLAIRPSPDFGRCISFTNGCQMMAIASNYGLAIYDLTAEEPTKPEAQLTNDGWASSIVIDASGRYLIAQNENSQHEDKMKCRLWDLSRGLEPVQLTKLPWIVRGKFENGGRRLYTSFGRSVEITQVLNEEFLDWTGNIDYSPAHEEDYRPAVVRGHDGVIRAWDVSSDGRWLVTGGEDNQVRLHEQRRNPAIEGIAQVLHIGRPVWDIAMDGNEQWLIACGHFTDPTAWSLRDGHPEQPTTFGKHEKSVRDCAVAPNGEWAATASDDGTIKVWTISDVETVEPVAVFQDDGDSVDKLLIHPGGRWLAATGRQGVIKLWRTDSPPKSQDSFQGPIVIADGSDWLEFASNGKWLVAGQGGKHVLLWDLTTETLASEPQKLAVAEEASATGIDPTGQWLVRFIPDTTRGTCEVWDLAGEKPRVARSIQVPVAKSTDEIFKGIPLRRIDVAPTGRWCRLGRWLVDLSDGANNDSPLQFNFGDIRDTLDRDLGSIESLAFTPNDQWLALGTSEGFLLLWELPAQGFDEPYVLNAHGEWSVKDILFSDGGKTLISAGVDGTIRFWHLSLSDDVALDRAR